MPGRHRKISQPTAVAAVTALAVLAVAAGSWFGYRQVAGDDCSGHLDLDVAAAAEIAGAVRTTARQWVDRDRPRINNACVRVTVAAVDPATMAAAVARQHKVSLLGVGQAPASVPLPDVWIPDSTTWLLRLRAEASGFVPTDGASVAASPVVLAMPAPAAQDLGWPGRRLTWRDLLDQVVSARGPRAGIVDPTRDAAGLAALLALGGAAGTGTAGAKRRVGALRTLAANSSSLPDDLLLKFPRAAADVGGGLGAAPLSEVTVVRYNAGRPVIPLAALYPEPGTTALDYPFATMPEVDAPVAQAAAALHRALRGDAYERALAVAGLRGPDGRGGPGFTAPPGAPTPTSRPPAAATGADGNAADAINQMLGSWAAITLPGRQLAVFDVSGSMLAKVPTAGGLTRAQVTQRAAAQGLALLDDQWQVGNWTFSTELAGKRPWRENVPIRSLSSARGELQAAIGKITPKPGGDTGLYDTALAAYRTVRDSWTPGRVNSVVLFTDGRNDNPAGLTRAELLTSLKKLRDPERPVRMVIIGIGNEVDRGELEAIVDATGSGGVFIAEDPARIGEIFLQAIATRSGA